VTRDEFSAEYDRIHAALPRWASDTSDVPLSICIRSAFIALELQVQQLTLERDMWKARAGRVADVEQVVPCDYDEDEEADYRLHQERDEAERG
jgi:hypothetical protein